VEDNLAGPAGIGKGGDMDLRTFSVFIGFAVAANAAGAAQDAQARRKVVDGYGKLPLAFEANGGQAPSPVKFLARGPGYEVFLSAEEAVLSLSRSAEGGGATLRMKLASANPAAVTGEDVLPGKSNYFIGNDPQKWRSNLPNYAKVRYHGVYAGVDLIYYGNQGHLEYDFVVAPGADPKAIRLDFGGVRGVRMDRAMGDLLLATVAGNVRFCRPVVYQGTEHRQAVDGRYVLRGNRVQFAIGKYDHTQPLIIDPALSYSSYLGGVGGSAAYGIAADASGNTYVAGGAEAGFPITAGALQANLKGRSAAFISKFDTSGALVYSTYLGGSGGQGAYGIAVDLSGDAYVTGSTSSTDFPTTPGVYQPNCSTCGTYIEAFVSEVNSSGSALVYSTYIGGSVSTAIGNGIAVDALGNTYVVGTTQGPGGTTKPSDFPTTPGAFQTNCGDGGAFVTKFVPGGSALIYSTCVHGTPGSSNNADQGMGIAIDSSGNAYITGYTQAIDFPTTAGVVETTCVGSTEIGADCEDAFVTKLNAAGSGVVYSTYFGYSSTIAQAIAVDSAGDAYIAGATCASLLPVTANAFQRSYAAQNGGFNFDCDPIIVRGDAFVTELSPDASTIVYSTYLGGQNTDFANGIALDSTGNIWVTGNTCSTTFPVTVDALQFSNGNDCNNVAFLTELNTQPPQALDALIYSTYVGSNSTYGQGVAADTSGAIYLTGYIDSGTVPTTPGAFQTTPSGGISAFVTKFIPGDQLWPLALNFANQPVGVTSAPLTTTLTSSENGPLYVTNVAITGPNNAEFAQTNDCAQLTVGCMLNVTFAPSGPGTANASLVVTTSGPNSPLSVALTGVVQPAVTLSPNGGLSFPNQIVGTTSSPQSLELSNTGYATLNIASIAASGDFAQTNNCGSSVAAGAGCNINVTFTPTATGTRSGMVTITDNAPGSPQAVLVVGTGVAPAVKLQPASFNLGSVTVGGSSATEQSTLTNDGTAPLTIGSLGITGTDPGDFSQTNTCPISPAALAVGGKCTISVTFTPTAEGSRTASISIADNASGSPQSVSLRGVGLAPVVRLAPSSISFTSQNVGAISTPRTVTVTNSGNATLAIAKIEIGGADPGDFGETTSTCNSPVPAGKNCTIGVTFSPHAVGPRSAALNITDNAADSPQSVTLTGTGTAPAITLSPTSLTFAAETVGKTSPGQTVTLSNTGTGSLTIDSILVAGTNASEFGLTSHCGATLQAAKSCTFTIKFTPAATGTRTADVSSTDNASGSPQTVGLTGTGK
jgi:hypothetical protein